jgi:hypothetical protein
MLASARTPVLSSASESAGAKSTIASSTQAEQSFSVRKLGSPDRALDAATFFLAGAVEASRVTEDEGDNREP